VLHARVEEIERLRSQSTSEKENMYSKLMFLENETASLHSKLQEKQAKLNKALGDISKYQRESEQSKRQLDAFRASKEVTEERLREEQDKLHKSEQNCEQLSDMLKKNVERHANVLSAN
jgi:chromosome segregation ATPase